MQTILFAIIVAAFLSGCAAMTQCLPVAKALPKIVLQDGSDPQHPKFRLETGRMFGGVSLAITAKSPIKEEVWSGNFFVSSDNVESTVFTYGVPRTEKEENTSIAKPLKEGVVYRIYGIGFGMRSILGFDFVLEKRDGKVQVVVLSKSSF